MKAHLECIPCLLKQSLNATKVVTDDQAVQEKVLRSVMKVLIDTPVDYVPPEIARTTYSIVDDITGCDDPYKNLKMEYNQIGMRMYPYLKDIVDKSDDRLFTAVKIAIAGNIIDFGADIQFDVKETIKDVLTKEFAINDYPLFVESLEDSESILYLADNAGEVAFDRILIEEIIDYTDVVYAVKNKPIINDATIDDALFCGIDSIAEIVTTADTPGTILERCDPEFVSIFRSADVIISKGQGNYETLSEEAGNIFFLLLAKCPVIAADLGVEIRDAVLLSAP
ncbi:MAG: ARMT1-like domain-containing protein [Euryarchaeota archaeon]|nr:ARMT1-like domain-containing protein [Euryarchaeota archaeon]